MKFEMPLFAVKDINASKEFYLNVLGQKVTLDLGQNVTLEDGFALQQDLCGLIGCGSAKSVFKNHDHELYFEEEDFEKFIMHLRTFKNIEYLHGEKEYPWGQRVVRFYDPDGHIIEVGEAMAAVFRKFSKQGMSPEEVAERTMHPLEFVKKFI